MRKLLSIPILLAVFAVAKEAPGQNAISISGIAVDVHRAPVPGASVTLLHRNLAGTTDRNGRFVLSGPLSAKRLPGSSRPTEQVVFRRGIMTLTLPRGAIDVRMFRIDLSGRITPIVCAKDAEAGTVSANLCAAGKNASGIFFLDVMINGVTRAYKVMNMPGVLARADVKETASSFPNSLSATAPPLIDTLIVEKDSCLARKIPLAWAIDTLDTIFLYPKNPVFTSHDFPSSDGSTSAQPLNLIIACRLLGSSYAWQEQPDGSKKMVAYSSSNPALADSINTILISHTGTHTAYVNVITGVKQLGYICRPPSPDECRLSDSLKAPIDFPDVALDAFVFLENAKNPVASLTIPQIQGIYTGQTTSWSAVGGWNNRIQPYQREANSGSQELLISLVMKDLKIISAPNMIVMGMTGPFNMLTSDTNGICYTVYFYQKFMAPASNVKSIAVDSVIPDYANIQRKRYPLCAPVVLASRKDLDPTCKAAMLREFLLAPEGQAIVKASGYVPIIDQ